MRTFQPSFIREILRAAAKPDVISLAGGLPRPDLFPIEAFGDACSRTLIEDGSTALQYTTTAGHDGLREWIADRLTGTWGRPVEPESVLITTGSQQGIDVAGKLFGDRPVAMENPGYLGAILAFRANGIDPLPVDLTTAGPDVDLLETRDPPPGLFYGMSRFQNPRGSSYSSAEGTRLASELDRLGIYMLEDDPYGELGFADGTDAAPIGQGGTVSTSPMDLPIAALAPERTIYLGSFSKSVAPSLRIGFLTGPPLVVRQLERLKQAADLHTSGFLQAALFRLLTGGEFDYEAHLRQIRSTYRAQCDVMLNGIPRLLPGASIPHEPAGGMFAWVELPCDASLLFEEAIKEGVAFVPGIHFDLKGGTGHRSTARSARMNFSNSTPEELTEAIRRLSVSLKRISL